MVCCRGGCWTFVSVFVSDIPWRPSHSLQCAQSKRSPFPGILLPKSRALFAHLAWQSRPLAVSRHRRKLEGGQFAGDSIGYHFPLPFCRPFQSYVLTVKIPVRVLKSFTFWAVPLLIPRRCPIAVQLKPASSRNDITLISSSRVVSLCRIPGSAFSRVPFCFIFHGRSARDGVRVVWCGRAEVAKCTDGTLHSKFTI